MLIVTPYSEGDLVFIPDSCSLQSMIYYGEHRAEISCPCSWTHTKAVVTKTHGNYVYVQDLVDLSRITAFYHKDLTLVQKAGANNEFD